MAGGIILLVIVGLALAAPWVAPHDPYAQDLSRRMIPPVWQAKGNWDHLLGTDKLGRDYLSAPALWRPHLLVDRRRDRAHFRHHRHPVGVCAGYSAAGWMRC